MPAKAGKTKSKLKKIAFIGPNPDLFLMHLPKYNVEEFYFIEQNEQCVQSSYDRITNKIANNKFESMPDKIEPVVLDEEKWLTKFKEN